MISDIFKRYKHIFEGSQAAGLDCVLSGDTDTKICCERRGKNLLSSPITSDTDTASFECHRLVKAT